MRTYERSGIHIDQCVECRGVFLDRGELERLMDAEASHYGGQQRPSSPPAAAPAGHPPADRWGDRDAPRRDRRRDDDWDDDRDDDDRRGGQPRRRRGFLGDVFEVFD
jgi:Zn-finger nucleic acid-binding protein